MFSLFKKTETLDEKYLRALEQTDGTWTIDDGLLVKTVTFETEKGKFTFTKEAFISGKYFEYIDDKKRTISRQVFDGVYRIAQEHVASRQIHKLGGYILDDDLRQAIADTKKIMNANDQIETLTKLVEQIYKKHKK